MLRLLRLGRSLEATTVDEIMTTNVLAVDGEVSLEEIMEILDTNRIQRVPVTTCGKLVGIVSRPDVIRAVVQPQFMRVGVGVARWRSHLLGWVPANSSSTLSPRA